MWHRVDTGGFPLPLGDPPEHSAAAGTVSIHQSELLWMRGGIVADPDAKVPNPRKADLERLRSDLAKEVESIKKTLKGPTEQIGGDKVWVGKNARAWHRELDGRHKKLVEQVDKLLPIIDAAIRSEPEKVSQSEARMYNKDL